ncbi:MAG: hypothetical protein MUF64_23040 [Polyangiaceae bacterium]|nr:hypothetical protein [Polyangiaceae bacterium]
MEHEAPRDLPVRLPSDRAFGLTAAALASLVALAPLLRHAAPRWPLLVVAALLALLATLRPAALGPAHRAFRALTRPLQRLSQALLLGALYFLILTPFALLRRTLGSSPISPRPNPHARTYWVERDPGSATDFRRPF